MGFFESHKWCQHVREACGSDCFFLCFFGGQFVIDTPSLQSKKSALEEKLQQVDKASSIYSRKRIFIEE